MLLFNNQGSSARTTTCTRTIITRTTTLTTLAAALILTCNLVCHITAAEETADEVEDFEKLGLHYGKYLKEVVAALDKDQKFTQTIKSMNSKHIKSGEVAQQLNYVHEDIRKRLNDLKYLEIKRLRDLAMRKNEIETMGQTYHGTDKRKWRTLGTSLSQVPEHLDSHTNFFDVNDLHKLMVAATNDLEKLDKERREDYKTYEMEKEWQFQERLKMMNETEKTEAIKLRNELKEKHDNHAKVHEPGTKQQFQDVWEKQDHLPANEFDPKTFFSLHDTNSDNYWDPQEVRQLLTTEINKMYDPKNQEDDPNEMEEEFERMREHIYKEIDIDKDGLISSQEFIEYSKKPQFAKDNGWEDNSKHEAYSKQDYEDYMQNREKYLKAQHGHYDPAYYAQQPQNFHLPNWGMGMPAGVNPAQYYGYHVDPNHPQAQQILAAQQQQHMAYQQAAYHQQAAAVGAGYQQPNQQYHPAQVAQMAQPGQIAQQQPYQAVPQVQNNNQYNPQQAVPQQLAYTQQQQHPAVPQQNQQNIPQPQGVPQQQQAIPQQQPPAQGNYQQVPQQQQQQAIPQQPVQQQQQQVPMQQQVPQQQQQQQQQQAPPIPI